MTKEDLMRARKIKGEIKLLKEQKEEIKHKISGMSTPHSVQASSKCEPYQLHNITIQGVAKSETAAYLETDEKREKIILDLSAREREYLNEYDKINKFIEGIPGSELRQMFSLYYLLGHSWKQVANRMGYQDESTPRKATEKFLIDSENSEL